MIIEEVETAKTRAIKNMSLLTDMQGNLVEISIDLGGLSTPIHIENLIVTEENGNIILDSLSEECNPLHIDKEKLLEIDYEFTNCLTLYMLAGIITITKI